MLRHSNDRELAEIPPKRDLTRAGFDTLPEIIIRAGERASWRFIEFFTAQIRNKNTRQAYARAVRDFFSWCEARGVIDLSSVKPVLVAAYIEAHQGSAPTVKQHLAAIKMLFDWLVLGHIMEVNPAHSVRGPKHIVRRGKTPVLKADQARALLDCIETETIVGLRDRALIGVMVYSFARVSAVIHMRVEDYYENGRRSWFRLHEKGGKRHEVPAHHNAEAYMDAYLDKAGIAQEKKTPLFRSVDKHRKLTENPMTRIDVFRMIKRRATAAGLPYSTCCHTFRATGITAYLELAEQSRTPKPSPPTNHREQRSSTTAPEMKSPSTKWSGSRFDFLRSPEPNQVTLRTGSFSMKFVLLTH